MDKRGDTVSVITIIIIGIVVCYFVFPAVFENGYSQVQNFFKGMNITLPVIPAYNGTLSYKQNQTNINPGSSPNPNSSPNPIPSYSSVSYTSLDSYLSANPSVNYWINQMSSATKAYFLTDFNNLETTGSTGIQKPNVNLVLSALNTGVSSQQQDSLNQIFAAKVAHAVWLDKENKVPWKLNSYTQDELGNLLKQIYPLHETGRIYLDWSPDSDYQYSSQFISDNKLDTIGKIIDGLRDSGFRHISDTDVGLPSESTIQGGLNDRIAVGGCHGMSEVVAGLSDNLNIITANPDSLGYDDTGWIGTGHSGVTFIDVAVLLHGDDIYTSALRSTPGNQIVAPWNYFIQYIQPVGLGTVINGHGQWNYYASRYNCLDYLKYPPITMKNVCCGNNRDTCIAQFDLTYDYITPAGSSTTCLTPDEINQLYTKMMAMC